MKLSAAEAAEAVAGIALRYAQRGESVAAAALAGARRFDALRHYPKHDVIDQAHGSGFFYHAHASTMRPAHEHGHFHLFCYPPGCVQGRHSHLVALSLDARGMPLRWFTVNDWVTGGRWLGAQALARRLEGFELITPGRLAPVAAWLTAMVRLYAHRIAALLAERDRQVNARGLRGRRNVEVISQAPIDLLADLRGICAQPAPETPAGWSRQFFSSQRGDPL